MAARPNLASVASRRFIVLCTILSFLVLFAEILNVAPAAAFTRDKTGKWTPRQPWESIPIHMALLRGDGEYHSKLLWFAGTDHHERFWGGLRGWRPYEYDGSTFPADSTLLRLPFDVPLIEGDTATIFCSGHSQLASDGGKILLAGGTQGGTEFGIRQAFTFDANADSNVAWQERDSMDFARWYPTVTTLAAGGKMLVISGSHHQHLEFFGGLSGTDTVVTDSALFRYGIGQGGVSVSPVRTSHTTGWPRPREGHSAARYPFDHTRMFGGRLRNGQYTNEILQLRRPLNPDSADYDYTWDIFTEAGPSARWKHTAWPTEQDSARMIIFGGVDKNFLNQDQALSDIWRFKWSTGLGHYVWFEVTVTNPNSSDAPGPRSGHVSLWHAPSRSALVFGGRSTPNGTPTDSALYRLAFNSTMTQATWSKLSTTGPSPRAEMALAYTSDWIHDSHTHAFLFGGQLASGKSEQLWDLQISDDLSTVSWSQVTGLAGAPPSPRSGTTMLADGGNHRLYIFGGSATDDTVYFAQLGSDHPQHWAAYARNTTPLRGPIAIFEDGGIAQRMPEIITPPSGTWSQLGHPLLQEWYPQVFSVGADTVFVSGPDEVSRKLAISTGEWRTFPQAPTTGFKGGGAVLYGTGKIMKAGSRDTDGKNVAAVGTTMSVNLTQGAATIWRASTNDMAPRVNHNLVALPNGKILVVGGTSWLNNDTNSSPEYRPQIWDPNVSGGLGRWFGLDTLDRQPTIRDYHSVALLLPDARIIVGGGNAYRNNPDSAHTVEIFSPPYLFKGDTLATRPKLFTSTGRWRYNADVALYVNKAIGSACLIHPGSTTHAQDEAQRYVPLSLLSYSVLGDGSRQYLLKAPPDSGAAPPGDYLLFANDTLGVPSVANWVRVGSSIEGLNDAAAPDTLLFGAEFITCDKIYLNWVAPGDDGHTGIALDYDVRYSTSPVTTSTFSSNTRLGGLPIPLLAGTVQKGDSLVGLAYCTWYYFGGKTRDREDKWSAIARTKYKTSCSGLCYTDPGDAMRGVREEGLATRAAVSTGLARAKTFAAPTALSESGSSLRLVAEYAEGSPCHWTLAYRDFSADQATLQATVGRLVVQEPLAEGGWSSRSVLSISPGSLGVRSLIRNGRVVFPAGTSLQAIEPAPQSFLITQASHSRLGDLTAIGSALDNVSIESSMGDTLTLAYEPDSTSTDGEDQFFSVFIPGGSSSTHARALGRIATGNPLPTQFALHPARPNPFRNETALRFDLPSVANVQLEVFDVQGRRVAEVVDRAYEAGRYSVSWDGSTNGGSHVPAGVYLVRMKAGDFHFERRLVLTR